MTRNRELYLEDIIGCKHEPETPIIDNNGNIIYWVCRCGQRHDPKTFKDDKDEEPTKVER